MFRKTLEDAGICSLGRLKQMGLYFWQTKIKDWFDKTLLGVWMELHPDVCHY
jgi:hypothetical protein